MPSHAEILRPHAFFGVPAHGALWRDEVDLEQHPSRLAIEVELAKRIAGGLTGRDFKVSSVTTGTGGGAGFWCRLSPHCEITVHVAAERRENGTIRFCLMSWRTAPLMRQLLAGEPKPSPHCEELWKALCRAMNDILVENFAGMSVAWRTEEESRHEP